MTQPSQEKRDMPNENALWYPGRGRKRLGDLHNHEYFWRSTYDLLLSKGYQLRPRYKPGCKFTSDEERIPISNSGLNDAIRIQDQSKVLLKRLFVEQLPLCRRFSEELQSEPANRVACASDFICVPPDGDYLVVIPYLHLMDEPQFENIGEMVQAMDQFLEGLAFIHQQNVALRHISWENLMMDASEMIPKGWHFARPWTQDGSKLVKYFPRSSVTVKYYIHAFDMASNIDPITKSPPIVQTENPITRKKKSKKPPKKQPDCFKTDVWHLGSIFKSRFLDKYDGLECLEVLIGNMAAEEEATRPAAEEARLLLSEIGKGIDLTTKITLKPKISMLQGIRKDPSAHKLKAGKTMDTVRSWFS